MDSDTKTGTKQECHLCTRQDNKSKATRWCCECSEALCENCFNLHTFIKLFKEHKVVKIEEVCTADVPESDLTAISVACPVHSAKVIEAYCFAHEQLCCIICLALNHRQCEKVQVIEEIRDVQKDISECYETELLKIESTVGNILKDKQRDHEFLENSYSNIENTAIQSVIVAKQKLDTLLASFLNELTLARDHRLSKSIEKLDMIDKLINRVREMIRVTKIVRNFGSKVQLFIQFEKNKQEIHIQMEETDKMVRETKAVAVDPKFIIDETFLKLNDIESIGKMICMEKDNQAVGDCSLLPAAQPISLRIRVFDNMYLKKKKIITHSGDIRGGICVSDQFVIDCGYRLHNINLIDVNSGKLLKNSNEYDGVHSKRLALDEKNGTLFISSYSNRIYCVPFNSGSKVFGSPSLIKVLSPFNGGVCIYNGILYVVVGNEIQKMDLSKGDELQTCFKTNTDCTDLNGLAVDIKNKRLVHTTRDFQVVCTTFEGTEIFSYKDKHMKKVTSLTVSSDGLIFAGDEAGYVHMISEDGKRRKTALKKPKDITRLCDVWLDKSEKTLFICGDQSIEMYDIHY